MILNVRHRGLKRLYENDDPRRVNPEHVEKLRNILARLDVAQRPEDMDLFGFRLHPLTGDRAGTWSTGAGKDRLWLALRRFATAWAHHGHAIPS